MHEVVYAGLGFYFVVVLNVNLLHQIKNILLNLGISFVGEKGKRAPLSCSPRGQMKDPNPGRGSGL